MSSIDRHICVSCGSKTLIYGYVGIGGVTGVFVPSGVFRVSGFRTRSYVCLKCGYVGQFLPESKLQKLKVQFKDELEES